MRALRGTQDRDSSERRLGLRCDWTQNSLGMAGPFHQHSGAELKHRFTTAVKVKPGHQRHLAHNILHSMDLFEHVVSQHRTARWEMPPSLLRVVKLHNILPAPLFSTDGQFSRRDMFLVVKRGDITVLLPLFMAFLGAAAERGRAAMEILPAEELYRKVAAACRYKRGVSNAARI